MTAKRTILALTLITLGSLDSPRAWAQLKPPTIPSNSQAGQPGQQSATIELVYVVYSRSGPDRPWFNGNRYTVEKTAVTDVERLKKAGYDAFYRAEAIDGGPPAQPPVGTFRLYVRSDPSDVWYEAGTYKTRLEADQRALAIRRLGYQVFIR